MTKRYGPWICWLERSARPAHAQEAPPFWHLSVRQGLSKATVTAILQDPYGFTWFGSEGQGSHFLLIFASTTAPNGKTK
jgi:hypothetical protein